jgi:hypothetical protein
MLTPLIQKLTALYYYPSISFDATISRVISARSDGNQAFADGADSKADR